MLRITNTTLIFAKLPIYSKGSASGRNMKSVAPEPDVQEIVGPKFANCGLSDISVVKSLDCWNTVECYKPKYR